MATAGHRTVPGRRPAGYWASVCLDVRSNASPKRLCNCIITEKSHREPKYTLTYMTLKITLSSLSSVLCISAAANKTEIIRCTKKPCSSHEGLDYVLLLYKNTMCPQMSDNSQELGFMYEFDCKPAGFDTQDPNWLQVQFEKQVNVSFSF